MTEAANRAALVEKVVAYLKARPHEWTAEQLESLDETGWAIVAGSMGRTRPFSELTRRAVIRSFRQCAAPDPFAGLTTPLGTTAVFR